MATISKNQERYNLLKNRYETATNKYIGEGSDMQTEYKNGWVYIGVGRDFPSKVRIDKFEKMTLSQERRVDDGESKYPKQELEKGGAGIKIVLSDSTITVYHSDDNSILHEVKQVPEGSWNKIWEAIREIKSAKNPVKS